MERGPSGDPKETPKGDPEETPRRLQRDPKETPRGLQGDPKETPANSMETPRRPQGDSKETPWRPRGDSSGDPKEILQRPHSASPDCDVEAVQEEPELQGEKEELRLLVQENGADLFRHLSAVVEDFFLVGCHLLKKTASIIA